MSKEAREEFCAEAMCNAEADQFGFDNKDGIRDEKWETERAMWAFRARACLQADRKWGEDCLIYDNRIITRGWSAVVVVVAIWLAPAFLVLLFK